MTILTTIEAMREAGCDDATILRAVEVIEKKRLKGQRDRVRRHREAKRRTRNESNACNVSHITKKENSPRPPKRKNTPPIVPPGGRYSEQFEAFWEGYPRKRGTSKAQAGKVFEKLAVEDQAAAQSALPAFNRSVADSEPRFIPHAATWINQRRWETFEPEPVRLNGRTAEQWRGEIRLWRDFDDCEPGAWLKRIGSPTPGKPGCLCPPEIQREYGFDPAGPLVIEGAA